MTPPSRTMVVVAAGIAALVALGAAGCHKGGNPESLPDLGGIGVFSLMDQDGKPFTNETMRGSVTIAAFFFTRCPTICPKLTKRMRRLQKEGPRFGADFRLVSFSVDPENDTPEVLRAFAGEYGADTSTWSFLTGDLEVVKKTCVQGFKVALSGAPDPRADHYGVLHGSRLVLVDRALRIRGYYDPTRETEMRRLLMDARTLANAAVR